MASNGSAEVVVITGASAGVGRAVARAFGARGAKVALLARGRDGLEGAARDVERAGGEALVLPTDVADAAQVEAAAQAVENAWGRIDIWINDAMVSVFSPVAEMKPLEYKRVTDVTYLGYVYGTMAALKRMRAVNKGSIVQVGSALAYRSIPLQSAYCAAKHAVLGFTESLRCELFHEKSDVHITMVQLPAVNTPQFSWVKSRLPRKAQPVPPIYQPEVVADAIVWAALHPRRREYYVAPSAVKAIIGNKVIPGLLDRYLGKVGYDAQQTKEPADPRALNNLWVPVPGDRGAHGTFDARARRFTPQPWLSHHRVALTFAAAAAVLGVGAMRFMMGR